MTVQHRVNVIRPTFIGLNMKFPVHKSLQNTTGNAGFSTTAICTCNQNSRHRFHIFHILIHLHITFPRLFTFFILERIRSVDKNHLNPCLPAASTFTSTPPVFPLSFETSTSASVSLISLTLSSTVKGGIFPKTCPSR